MADNILKVNHLPVLTWFHNQLNDSELKVKDSTEEAIRTADHPAYLVKPEFPKEIIVKEGVSPTDLLKMYEDEGASINRETYVAGKYPIYHEQPFATGMGKEIDDLIVKMGAPARVIEVPENVKIKDPVYLHYLYPDGSEDVDTSLIRMRAGSEMTVIQYMDSQSTSGTGFAGTQTRVIMEKGAKLHLVKVQCLADGFTYFNDMGSRLAEDSDFRYTELSLGAKESYLGTYTDQIGDESKFRADLGFIITKGTSIDINYDDVFRKIEIEYPSCKYLIEQLKSILPPQHKEWRTLIKEAKSGNSFAYERLILMYLRTILKRAYDFSKTYYCDFEDCFQNAVIGFINAINKYDVTSPDSFVSYFQLWLVQLFLRILAD